jgi:hypothetical protein
MEKQNRRALSDLFPRNDYGLFVYKPDSNRLLGSRALTEVADALLRAVQLEIVDTSFTQVSEEELRLLYTVLNIPSEFGEGWKIAVINHLTQSPLKTHLVRGDNAFKKATIVKSELRSKLTTGTTQKSRVVENVAHVPDPEDFEISYSILFRV